MQLFELTSSNHFHGHGSSNIIGQSGDKTVIKKVLKAPFLGKGRHISERKYSKSASHKKRGESTDGE